MYCVVRVEDVSATLEWLRAKLSFEVLRSALLCVRGWFAWYKKDQVKISQDFRHSIVDSVEAGLCKRVQRGRMRNEERRG